MTCRQLDDPRARVPCLNQHAAARIAGAAGAAGQLCEQCERALLGAEVRCRHPRLGVEHGRQRDPGHVVPLGDELRADQDGPLGSAERVERGGRLSRAPGDIRIQPQDGQPGIALGQLELDRPRARADPGQIHRPTGGAGAGRLLAVAAVVAAEPRRAVQRERHVAPGAAPAAPAGAAVDGGGRAASVLEEDGAPALVFDPPERVAQRPRKRVSAVTAQVDHLDLRQRAADPGRQGDAPGDAVP